MGWLGKIGASRANGAVPVRHVERHKSGLGWVGLGRAGVCGARLGSTMCTVARR